LKWYRLAAEQGVTAAEFNLGFGYRRGLGVLQNNAEAIKWFLLAARQGDAQAQHELDLMSENG